MQYIFYSYKNKVCYADSQCLLTDLYVFKRFSIRKIKRSVCLVIQSVYASVYASTKMLL